MDDSRNNGPETDGRKKNRPPVHTQFQPGNPGRPKGSRNKLGEAFIAALHDDFMEHGTAVIAQVRVDDPAAYVKVCASLLPKEVKVTASVEELTDEQLSQRIRQLAAALNLELGHATGVADQPSGAATAYRPH